MTLPAGLWPRILFCASFGSAAAALFSIAISQILLGVAIVAFLVCRPRLALPVWFIPLGLFILWTLISYFAAGDLRTGLPQIRKLYVLALLPLVYVSFRGASDFKALAAVWMIAGSAAALRSCWQFADKWLRAARAGQDFYQSYVADRITGFMSHWMTFSSQMMFVFLAALCLLLWGRLERRLRWLALFTLSVTGAALVLGFTRGVWIAAAAACLFLLARWKPWAMLAFPVLLLGVTLAGPESLRSRIASIARPQGELDSNQHRIVSWTTGMKMIQAHPLLGIGPEQVGRQFDSYVPPTFRRPLPEGFYGHLHNIYLQYSAERGIPATLFILAFLLWPAVLWLRAASKLPAGDPAIWALNFGVAAIIGVLVTGIFEHNLGDSEVLSLTLATLAAAAAAQVKNDAPGSTAV
ncbi:MAG: hypothetical protein C0504_01295 [Candidatus Solibacter sp.]|nr:hypothetical protein [Candidatus Solibacter sp.]